MIVPSCVPIIAQAIFLLQESFERLSLAWINNFYSIANNTGGCRCFSLTTNHRLYPESFRRRTVISQPNV